jgi:oligopeptide transport system substrate-binding protein
MRKSKVKHLFIPLACFLLLLSSCSHAPLEKVEQQLNLNIPSDPATLDPRKGGDLISSMFHFLLFDGLTRLNEEGNISLSLADKVDISNENTVYTFYLKEAYWSDGTAITAWDFEKSWKDILNPNFPSINAHLLYPILNAEGAKKGDRSLSEVGIDSLDARRLRVTLAQPTPYFLELISFCVFYPVNSEIDHSNRDWDHKVGQPFVCSGPFALKEWKRNNTIVLERNPHYHRASKTRLEEIHLSMVDNEMTALQMFEKGQIDIIGQPTTGLPIDAVPELVKTGLLKVNPVPATTICTFNTNCFPFNNANIRKAFSYAMNRHQIVQNITQLSEDPATTVIPPALKKITGTTSLFQDGDTARAKRYFIKGCEELGISPEDFPKIQYIYSKSETHHKIAQVLQHQWLETLNVHIKLDKVDKKILLYLLSTRNYQAAQCVWMAQYRDAMNIFERFKHKDNVKNYPNWESAKYIDLINRSCKASSPEERFAILDEAEMILIDEMPIAPIFHWNAAYISKPWVKSYGKSTVSNGLFEHVWIDVKLKKASQ